MEPTAAQNVINLFSPLSTRYDLLCEVLSMGQNRRWRRCMIERTIVEEPGTILDVASGTAGVAIELVNRTAARVVAYDLTLPMLKEGVTRVAHAGVTERISLVGGRAEQLPFSNGSFDALTFTYLLRYVESPQETLKELTRVVRPGGRVASLEFLVPPNPAWRSAWWVYTRLVLPIAGWITGGPAWWRVGRFLGPNISNFYRRYSIERIVQDWKSAGLEDVSIQQMSLGGGVIVWGHKRRV